MRREATENCSLPSGKQIMRRFAQILTFRRFMTLLIPE
jgi:hypothetical protein